MDLDVTYSFERVKILYGQVEQLFEKQRKLWVLQTDIEMIADSAVSDYEFQNKASLCFIIFDESIT